jgi:N-acylneuraminate cytidylyltransferase
MLKSYIESTLVVIPARGGSQRIPNKNVKEIFGQPMIYWPLMELRKIFSKDNVLISTDSEHIKDYVERKGLKVPFMRPKSLSDNFTGTAPVVEHALKWYEINVKKVDYVLTVYPTAVLLNEEDIRSAMILLSEDEECDSIMSATNFSFPIQRAVYENNFGYAEMFDPSHYSTRSQDLVEAKHDAGQFYLSRAEAVRNGALLTNSRVKLKLLHRNNVVDIDTIEDFEIAEQKLRINKNNMTIADWTF